MVQIRDKKLLRKIALAVKQLREARGLTQDEVYDELKIHIGRIETATANPTISTISAVCKYFKISLSDFFLLVEQV